MAVALRREIFGATRGRFDGWTGRHVDVTTASLPGTPGSHSATSSVPQATRPAGLPCRRRSAEHRMDCLQDSPAAQRYYRTYWDNTAVATLA